MPCACAWLSVTARDERQRAAQRGKDRDRSVLHRERLQYGERASPVEGAPQGCDNTTNNNKSLRSGEDLKADILIFLAQVRPFRGRFKARCPPLRGWLVLLILFTCHMCCACSLHFYCMRWQLRPCCLSDVSLCMKLHLRSWVSHSCRR